MPITPRDTAILMLTKTVREQLGEKAEAECINVCQSLEIGQAISLARLLAIAQNNERKRQTAAARDAKEQAYGFDKSCVLMFYESDRDKWDTRQEAAVDLTDYVNHWRGQFGKLPLPLNQYAPASYAQSVMDWLTESDKKAEVKRPRGRRPK